MNENGEKATSPGASKGLFGIFSLASVVLGGGAIWYTWFECVKLASAPMFHWYEWIRPALMAVMGVLCLSAAVLFLLGKPSGSPVFKAGLFMVPLMLASNLVILAGQAAYRIVRGDALSFFERLIAQPHNLVIPFIVLAMIMLGVLDSREKRKNGT